MLDKKEVGIITKYYGSRKVQDIETGEIFEVEYSNKKVNHSLKRGWRRVYLEVFMEVLTGLLSSSRKIDVVEFILDNLNSENQFIYTQDMIVKKTGISKQTVNSTFKHLVGVDFMKKIGTVYVINPKFITAFGSDKKNLNILIKYENV
jgi:Fic family protein